MARSTDELMKRLRETVYFLHGSCMRYDEGVLAEALQLSVQIRKLFHETTRSHSLMGQLGVVDRLRMYDSATPLDELGSATGTSGLTVVPLGQSRYLPFLDEGRTPSRFVPFVDWWQRPILQDGKANTFTRQTLVLVSANQDGAHVDPMLHKAYEHLSNEGLGWIRQGSDPPEFLHGLIEASVRQVAHETLVTLAHDELQAFPEEVPRRRYRYLPGPTLEQLYGASAVMEFRCPVLDADGKPSSPTAGWPDRIAPQDPCPCGSGKKFKDCHGYG